MAPIEQSLAATENGYDGSRARFGSLEEWLKVYGAAEYVAYKRGNAPPLLSYEDWAASEHVLGPYLWHTTLDVWDEDSSSDEESEVEALKLVSRGPPKREPKKKVTNENGVSHGTNGSASTARTKSSDPLASPKRRRRPKKKFLSEEIVASDDSDEIEEPTPVVEVVSPAAPSPAVTANGRRKSGGRRKKIFLSEETISPEDLEDEPMSIDEVVASAAQAPKPSAPEPKPSVTAAADEPSKRKPGRKPKKKFLSEATVPLTTDEEDILPVADAPTPNSAAASPDGPSTSSASKRALRVRTPAQQRPYLHHAKVFEEHFEPEELKGESSIKRSPKAKPTKLAQISYPDDEDEEQIIEEEEEDPFALELEEPPRSSGKRHYKGKGRAWKKDEEDEDDDYVSAVKVKVKPTGHPKRKSRGARKSTQPSKANIPYEDDAEPRPEVPQEEVVEPEPEPERNPEPEHVQKVGQSEKPKRRPRKTKHLSEEFVRDDSDSEMEEALEPKEPPHVEESTFQFAALKTPKPKGRPRKSDPSTSSASKIPVVTNDDEADYTPVKRYTPMGKLRKSRASTIVSSAGTEEGRAGDNEDTEDRESLTTPHKKFRKRKSLGSDGGRS